jgi:hypothetical protein
MLFVKRIKVCLKKEIHLTFFDFLFLFTFLVDAKKKNPCQYNDEIEKPLNLDVNVDGEDFLRVCFRNLDLKELENINIGGHKCKIHS